MSYFSATTPRILGEMIHKLNKASRTVCLTINKLKIILTTAKNNIVDCTKHDVGEAYKCVGEDYII